MTTSPSMPAIALIGPPSRRADPMPRAGEEGGGPPFSLWPLLLVIVAKPLADAFYEVNAVKYGYMALLFYGVFFANCGRSLCGVVAQRPQHSLLGFAWWLSVYFYFLFGLGIAYGGSLQEIFKIVSPFIFFMLVWSATDRWMAPALALGAALVIVSNAALLPLDFGWTSWGGVRTFKGFYYFKTDLAYSLTFSVLILAIYYRFASRRLLLLMIALAGVQVVLANSRLNYLTYGLVMIYVALKGGIRPGSMIRYGLLFGALGSALAYFYGSTKLLGFDIYNMGAFTQGRHQIWGRVLSSLADYSPLHWLFGRGMYADSLVSTGAVSSVLAQNAHNEILHMIYTQGIVGSLFYVLLWCAMFRIAYAPGVPQRLRSAGFVAAAVLALQSLTAVVSSFATKTWPLVLVLLAVRAVSDQIENARQTARQS